MHQRIAVAFAGGGEQKRRAFCLRQAERVVRAERAHFQRRDRKLEIIDRARRRGKVEDEIELLFRQENEIRDVVLDEAVIFVARPGARCWPGCR